MSKRPPPTEPAAQTESLRMAQAATTSAAVSPVSFGERLRVARVAHGFALESCAQTLKLPVYLLRKLESDQWKDLEPAVYLASYLGKYARLLEIDEAILSEELRPLQHHPEPALVASHTLPMPRQPGRYGTVAVYLILVAVVIVPIVWLGLRGLAGHDTEKTASLDMQPAHTLPATFPAKAGTPAVTSVDKATVLGTAAATDGAAGLPAPASTVKDAMPAPGSPADAAATNIVGTGRHTLELSVPVESWAEIVAGHGSRLQYGLLPAGSHKTWRSDQPLNVRIGNASGAQIAFDGRPLDLEAYRRGNVLSFRLDVQTGKLSPRGVGTATAVSVSPASAKSSAQ